MRPELLQANTIDKSHYFQALRRQASALTTKLSIELDLIRFIIKSGKNSLD
jgi:hypothetical protein